MSEKRRLTLEVTPEIYDFLQAWTKASPELIEVVDSEPVNPPEIYSVEVRASMTTQFDLTATSVGDAVQKAVKLVRHQDNTGDDHLNWSLVDAPEFGTYTIKKRGQIVWHGEP